MSYAPARYPDPEYALDEELTDELRFRFNSGSDVETPKLRIAAILAPFIVFPSVFLGVPILVASGVTLLFLFVLVVARIQREGDSVSAECSSCGERMTKEVRGNVEFFVCHACKLYARGRELT